jgi:hypothetical protein
MLGVLTGFTSGAAPLLPDPTACSISWNETNLVARGGWGRMIRRTDGDWLCVTTRFNRTNSTLQLQLSRDGARSWKRLTEVEEPLRFLDNGELILLADGSILLTGRSLIEGQSYRLPVYRSTDAGRTWTYRSTIDANEGPPGTLKDRGLWEPHFYRLRDGRLAVAYANEKHASSQPVFSQVCSLRISPDAGESWGPEIVLAAQPGGGLLRPGMPVVTRLNNGGFIAVYEVVGAGDADVFYKISEDGEQWPSGLGERIEGHHAAPWVTALADGRLLLTSCANIFSCSHDEGRSWHSAGAPPWGLGGGKHFTWPAVYQTGTNEVAAMVAWGGVKLRFGKLANSTENSNPQERSLPRSRSRRNLEGWNVQVDDRLLVGPNAEQGAVALRFLEQKLSNIKMVVSREPLEKLQAVTIVLDLGHGELHNLQYHPSAQWLHEDGYSTNLAKCVHIPEVADLATLRNVTEQPWVILHELAHAYHDQVLGFSEPRIVRAYENFKQSGHGDATLLFNGTRVRHYGLTDAKEFFAEMAEAYFGLNDFFPFNRAELMTAEPEIYQLMRAIWGPLSGAGPQGADDLHGSAPISK